MIASKNPATGKSELVPANMTYEEWHKKFVDGNPEAELNEKMERNKAQDKKQYAKYIKELDSYVPSDFKDFQRIKYTNKQEYGIIKAQYKEMGYYNKALTNEPEITKHIKAVAENTKLDIQGLENRIKTKDSYLRKIRSNYEQ